MDSFELDARLARDCLVLGEMDMSLVLLMNNSLLPWFILVPKTTETEMIDLPRSEQVRVLEEINLLSAFVKNHFAVSKLNIATIGNIVKQLHIHIVGRTPNDCCWPNVVWGTTQRENYSPERVEEIRLALKRCLADKFTCKK